MRLSLKKPRKYSYSPFVDGITQSNLSQWLDCREKCRKSLLLGFSGLDCSKPLIFGSISHEMLDIGYSYLRENKKIPKTISMVALEKWKKQNPQSHRMSFEIAEESSVILHYLLPIYFSYYKKQDEEIEWKSLEEEFCSEISTVHGTVKVKGKMDAVVLVRGKEALFETKNKGRISPMLMEVLPLDLQLDSYLTILGRRSASRTKKVIYNIIKRPGERRKQEESLNDFGKRIAEKAEKSPEEFFQRFEMVYTLEDLEKKEKRFEHLVQQFTDWWVKSSKLAPLEIDPGYNHQACEGKYGTCEFLTSCSRGTLDNLFLRSKAHPELEG